MSANWLPLKNRDFGKIWLGQVLSQMGTRMYQIAISWWIVKQGGEQQGLLLSILFVLSAIPALAFVKPIGRMVDTKSTKRLIFLSDVFAALITVVLLVAGRTGSDLLIPIYIVAFFRALFQSVIDPALFKAASQTVKKEDMESAIGLITTTTTVASFLGAFMGAAVMDHFSFEGFVLINAMTYVISAGCTAWAKFTPISEVTPVETGSAAQVAEARLEDIPGYATIRTLLLTFAAVNFFSVPTLIVIPVYTNKILQGNASHLALMEAALALGLLAGSFSSKYIRTAFFPLRTVFFCSLMFAATLAVPAVLKSISWYFACLALAGFAMGVLNVKIITFFEAVVPGELKGRFFAHLNAMTSVAMPISYLVFGFVIGVMPLEAVIAVQAAGILFLSFQFLSLSAREVREWA